MRPTAALSWHDSIVALQQLGTAPCPIQKHLGRVRLQSQIWRSTGKDVPRRSTHVVGSLAARLQTVLGHAAGQLHAQLQNPRCLRK